PQGPAPQPTPVGPSRADRHPSHLTAGRRHGSAAPEGRPDRVSGKSTGMADVTFFFDPACPWTWRASRWLTQVAETRALAVDWRPMSLLVVNDGDVPDAAKRAKLQASHRLLRAVARLAAGGPSADLARRCTGVG